MHCGKTRSDLLLDGKLASAAILALGFVDSAIGTAADEAYYIVVVVYPPLTSVSHRRHLSIGGLCESRLADFDLMWTKV